jgi:thioredoxin reductase
MARVCRIGKLDCLLMIFCLNMIAEVAIVDMHMMERRQDRYDVVVIGGGAAGLSAGLVLGRARRSVLVVDAGSPRNAPAAGVHGFLTRDGSPPSELLGVGRAEVERYGGRVIRATARTARRTDDGFRVTLDDGTSMEARRLLVTTGLTDELPDVPGLHDRWGRDVLHCPYCHGWEVRDRPVGILATGPLATHQALLFRQWTPDVLFFSHTAPALTDAQAEELAARGIGVVPGRVESVVVADDRLTGVRLQDGTVVAREALVVAPRFVARSEVLASLGLRPTPHPRGIGEHIAADPTGLTAVPGVWVAGNATDLAAQVVTAASQGVVAAAAINADLVAEETRQAVAAYRARPAVSSTHATRRAS